LLSLTSELRGMPSERVRDTFTKRFDLVEYVGPKAKVADSWHDERRLEALRHYSLTRMVLARFWLGRFKRLRFSACVCVGSGAVVVSWQDGLDPFWRCPSGDREASEV
jgi:hypothetical protein